MKQMLGRYEILGELGRGGMGVVYRAMDTALGRPVAIKTIRATSGSPELTERFVREARASARLSHPGIVTIYDVGREDDTLFIAMEFLDGRTLQTMLSAGATFDRDFVASTLNQVAAALDYAHSQGIVHRDVKPSNIMVLGNGTCKVMDFGIAKLLSGEKEITRGFVGTPAYISPEAIGGKNIGGRADQFSLGVVAYEMLTGRQPFDADDVTAIMYKILQGDFPPPSTFDPTLGTEVDQVFRKALARNPVDRYEGCAEFVRQLLTAWRKSPRWQSPPGRAASARPVDGKTAVPGPKADRTTVEPTPLAPLAPAPKSQDLRVPGLTVLAEAPPPTGFASQVFPSTRFFKADTVLFDKIEESLKFYRENLGKQYNALSKQADVTYVFWICCVALGFVILLGGLILMFFGDIKKGLITTASTALVYYIQRMFQQREDHYRKAADEKNAHLEYGNQWLLVIQSVEAIQDPIEKLKRQSALVDVLTKKLDQSRKQATPRKAKRRPA